MSTVCNRNRNVDKYVYWIYSKSASLKLQFLQTYSYNLNLHFHILCIINALTHPPRMFLHDNSKRSHLLQDYEINHGSVVGHKNLLNQERKSKNIT